MDYRSFKVNCLFAFALRLVLVTYADFHDKYFDVPYTDIDYTVFTDAARCIVEGHSPYDRHTYRYTPLVALLLSPNILLHKSFGKVVFSIVDILIALLINKILIKQNCETKVAHICALTWLYNPFTIVISTRGNADSLAVLLVLSTLYAIQNNHLILAGMLHGLSVHFRLYPVGFSLAMYLSLCERKSLIPNTRQIKLVLSCVSTLSTLTLICYYFYGFKFLYESLIYHLIRKDARHNFSVYFYMLYLTAEQTPSIVQKLFTFFPQLMLLLVLSFFYSTKEKLPFAMLTQAMVMVMYNPVMTSQYFFWFLSLLPLSAPFIKMSMTRLACLISIWALAQGIWLFAAYLLEFRGINTFYFIWLAGLLFFAANTKVLMDVISGYSISRSKVN
ncbi:GPI mannosyltransferase 1 [Orussus abietinus]|uniref:GPI mannosyltransferase 1 n=1 Tax=Orussus abietinus TaxID=222816 RepID=UPI000626730D|nr:GPI mannosyltransferase 1 [Orussus abietinus]